jgi:hypothetical protein
MNYIKHLTGFFEKIVTDHSLNPTHISLYVSLFQCWNMNRFQNPISINRDEVMRISKICSKATYHKCMRELHDKGYLVYEPSYNPFRGSLVYLFDFEQSVKPVLKKDRKNLNNELLTKQVTVQLTKPVFEQVMNKQQTGIGTATEQALVSSLNIINNTNSINVIKGAIEKKIENDNTKVISLLKTPTVNSKKKLREKKVFLPPSIPPQLEDVKSYFLTMEYDAIEAEKFFNHFQSNGWLVGGKSKMKDWKAAARNWMLNAKKFNSNTNTPQPQHLHATTQKNYGEPL